jgi:nitrate/nitrite-specific signal transduction histidine kinase
MELMVTEAASNAVRHVDGTQIVVMLDVNSHIEGAVRDEDPLHPRRDRPGPTTSAAVG